MEVRISVQSERGDVEVTKTWNPSTRFNYVESLGNVRDLIDAAVTQTLLAYPEPTK